MKQNKRKNRSRSRLSDLPVKSNLVSQLPASVHSLPTPSSTRESEETLLIHSVDVQLTVRAKIEISRKQLCYLASILISEIVDGGMNIKDWILLEFLYSRLLGRSESPEKIIEAREREISYLLKILLLSGNWMGLESRTEIPKDVQHLILSSKFIPTERTKASWTQHWQPDDYIEVRAVPLSVFMERSTGTQRYSGYCKGYGESGPAGNCKRTKFCSELDGEEPKEREQEIDLLNLGTLLKAVLLEFKYRNKSSKR
jgi:hypothetical protein